MANKHPNTSEIVRYKKQESESKKQEVLSVLRRLQLLDDPINHPISKAEICRQAGVSKTFLYSYPNEAIKEQNKRITAIPPKQSFSESSKDKVIESLKRRLQSLEEENKKLKRDNAILLGKLSKL